MCPSYASKVAKQRCVQSTCSWCQPRAPALGLQHCQTPTSGGAQSCRMCWVVGPHGCNGRVQPDPLPWAVSCSCASTMRPLMDNDLLIHCSIDFFFFVILFICGEN